MAIRASAHPFLNPKQASDFDPFEFLSRDGVGAKIFEIPKGHVIFSQGSVADAVFLLQKGRIRLSVVSARGKEATIALQNPGDFVGEECVASVQTLRLATATALTSCVALKIGKKEMVDLLRRETLFAGV